MFKVNPDYIIPNYNISNPDYDEYCRNYTANLALARDFKTKADVLEALSKDKEPGVRYCVSQHPNCSPETLAFLSEDIDFHVRYSVASNERTLIFALKNLAIDRTISEALLKNPAFTFTLENMKLINWKTPDIFKIFLRREILTNQMIEEFLNQDDIGSDAESIYKDILDTNVDQTVLDLILSKTKNRDVAEKIYKHASFAKSLNVLNHLLKDDNEKVRRIAISRLVKLKELESFK